uniref:U1 small nuclear ribonucleoprotein 70 kDa n=1 Tax=Oryzias latipes TaxID=8090 RepID=A0A3P9HR10_ORYLA
MTQFLPPNLLALFAPRDPIPFLPQLEKLPHEKHHNQPYSGIAPFIRHFEDPRDAPPPTRAETREERLERKRREKIERRQGEVETELKLCEFVTFFTPFSNGEKLCFFSLLNYDTTESKLRREFEVYGPIKRIYIVYNKGTGKPRGYAFIEYEHERDMHSAYKHADGKKIDGRRVLVDVERGRTVKGWLPRRLGELFLPDGLCFRSDRDRGERKERSRDRDRDKDRERRRSRSRDRRRHIRSQDRDRDREKPIAEDGASSRRRERERDRGGAAGAGAAAGGSSRSRERSRDRKRRSRSRDRKRDRERGKGLDGEEAGQGDSVPEPGERIPEEQEGEVAEGGEERKDRERDRDRRRSHRDRDRRRGERDRDREHKRDRGDRDRGERREERHASAREEVAPQGDGANEEDGGPTHMEEYGQEAMMDQQMVPSVDGYGSENGFKMEPVGEEY